MNVISLTIGAFFVATFVLLREDTVDVSDDEIPPEFLKPTPPPQEKQAEQVQLSVVS